LSLDKAIYRKLVINIGILLGGNTIAMVLGVITLGFNARALGATGLGILTLIQTYALILERLFAQDSWQPFVKMAAEAQAASDLQKIWSITAVGLAFDLGATLLSGVTAILLLFLVGDMIGFEGSALQLAQIFSATLFFRLSGTPTGVLRLFDRFSIVTGIVVIEAVVRLVVTMLLFLYEEPLSAYVITYGAIFIFRNVFLVGAGWQELRRQGVPINRNIWRPLKVFGHEYWRFSYASWLASAMNVSRQNGDVLLLGGLVGPAAVGIYSIGARIAQIASRFAEPVQQVIYPEVARMHSSGRTREMRKLVLVAGVITGGVGMMGLLVLSVVGLQVITLIAGRGFEAAYVPLMQLSGAVVIAMAGIGLRPLILITLGPQHMLLSYFWAFLGFAVVGPVAIVNYGVIGAGASQIAFNLVWLVVMLSGVCAWQRSQ